MKEGKMNLVTETALTTKTVDKETALKIVQTQVAEYLHPNIVLTQMYMTDSEGIRVLRIKYFIENPNFLKEEDEDDNAKLLRQLKELDEDEDDVEDDIKHGILETSYNSVSVEEVLANLTPEEKEMLNIKDDEELPYSIDMAIREGKKLKVPEDSTEDDDCPYFTYYLDIDEECNMVNESDTSILILPYVSVLIQEGFVIF